MPARITRSEVFHTCSNHTFRNLLCLLKSHIPKSSITARITHSEMFYACSTHTFKSFIHLFELHIQKSTIPVWSRIQKSSIPVIDTCRPITSKSWLTGLDTTQSTTNTTQSCMFFWCLHFSYLQSTRRTLSRVLGDVFKNACLRSTRSKQGLYNYSESLIHCYDTH